MLIFRHYFKVRPIMGVVVWFPEKLHLPTVGSISLNHPVVEMESCMIGYQFAVVTLFMSCVHSVSHANHEVVGSPPSPS